MYRNAWVRLLLFGASVLSSSSTSLAEIITFSFTGEVTQVDPLLAVEFSVGESVNGSYAFESTSPQLDGFPISDPGPSIGYYKGIEAFSADIGSDYTLSLSLGKGNIIKVGDNREGCCSPIPYDSYRLVLGEPIAQTVVGKSLRAFVIHLDGRESIYNSDDLPLVPPDLSEIEGDFSRFRFSSDGYEYSNIDFMLTSFTLSTIPESTTISLALFAVILLAICSHRTKVFED